MKIKITLLVSFLLMATDLVFAQNKIRSFQERDFRLALKLPHFNFLTLNPNLDFRDHEFGFNGYGIGLAYSYKDRKFLEGSGSFAVTFKYPLPLVVDAEYNKILTSLYVNLTDNFIFNRFTVGYGLHYSINTWKEWTRDFTQWGCQRCPAEP